MDKDYYIFTSLLRGIISMQTSKYTRSLDSAPSISAILRLVLIEKLPKSSFSALLELNTKSFPSDQCSFLAYFKQCSLNQCSVFVGPKRALSEDLVYLGLVMDPDLIPGPKGLGPCFLEGPKARESPSPIFGNVPENMSFLFSII